MSADNMRPGGRKPLYSISARHARRLIQRELQNVTTNEEWRNLTETFNTSTHSERSESNHLNQYITDDDILFPSHNSVQSESPILLSTSLETGFSNTSDDYDTVSVGFPIDNDTFKDKLALWATEENITHNSLGKLLKLLKTNDSLAYLPSDPRTLLQTPRKVILKNIKNGNYLHIGLKYGIEQFLKMYCIKSTTTIDICINIDGLPLSKSSGSQIWPILGSLFKYNFVFLIGAFHGQEKKPGDLDEYLNDFVTEAQNLVENGINFNNVLYKCNIKMIVADSPAKSFVLNVKYHSGYSSCTKCTIVGEYYDHRICFPGKSVLRTNEMFAVHIDDSYHSGPSPLKRIPHLGLVTNVVLDTMHLVYLGTLKRLLNLWTSGKLSFRTSFALIEAASKLLKQHVKPFVPIEFQRAPRSLAYFKMWKATEFRQLLLYSGPVVLKSILSNDIYIHFLTLHVALTILSSETLLNDYIDYAERLLDHFVHTFKVIYGKCQISHNIHGLLHLANDARKFGVVDELSAFKYENYLQVLKNSIRKSNMPLQQIHNRYSEAEVCNNSSFLKNSCQQFRFFGKKHQNDPVFPEMIVAEQYEKLYWKNCIIISKNKKNNCVGLKTGDICLVENFGYTYEGQLVIVGRNFLRKTNVYDTPCESGMLGIYLVHELSHLSSWPVEHITKKYFLYTCPWKINAYAAFPILHSDRVEHQTNH